ncbi:MAG: hypothetical protein ABIG60_04685 [Patescibacteria group bacterium]
MEKSLSGGRGGSPGGPINKSVGERLVALGSERSEEEVFGRALEAYYTEGKSEEAVLLMVPEGKRAELKSTIWMADFLRESAEEEDE